MSAATGFYSTAEDMVTFGSAHFFGDDRLISDRGKYEMQRTVWSNLGGAGIRSTDMATARSSPTTTDIAWWGTQAAIRATLPARCEDSAKASLSRC
ncbi:MAG: hypothetical protein R2843_11330 [Thermomicrobiales bacterium]